METTSETGYRPRDRRRRQPRRRREIVGAIPRSVPDAAADAAQDTIGAAVEASGGLPPHPGDALLNVAEHTFSATAGATTLLVLRRADTTSI